MVWDGNPPYSEPHCGVTWAEGVLTKYQLLGSTPEMLSVLLPSLKTHPNSKYSNSLAWTTALPLWPHFTSPVSFLACPVSPRTLQKCHSSLSALCGHTVVLPPGPCTGWCLPRCAFPPSIPFPTRKPPAVGKDSPVTSLLSSQVPQARTHHCHYHPLFTSCLALASKPTWNKCAVYQLARRKEPLSEEVKSPSSIHTFFKAALETDC